MIVGNVPQKQKIEQQRKIVCWLSDSSRLKQQQERCVTIFVTNLAEEI